MIPLNNLSVNKIRKFKRRGEKKNSREQNDGRQEVHAKGEMTNAERRRKG